MESDLVGGTGVARRPSELLCWENAGQRLGEPLSFWTCPQVSSGPDHGIPAPARSATPAACLHAGPPFVMEWQVRRWALPEGSEALQTGFGSSQG